MDDSLTSPQFGTVHFAAASREEVGFLVKEIFEDRSYVGHGISLEPGAVVIDAGANIGLFALFVDRELKGEARIYAHEPVPTTFDYLQQNLAENALQSVYAQRLGLGPIGGPAQVSFTSFPALPANSTQKPDAKRAQLDAWTQSTLANMKAADPDVFGVIGGFVEEQLKQAQQGEEVVCAMTDLRSEIAEQGIERIDLLKVDVEGAEPEVLAGLDDTAWGIVRQVALETHGEQEADQLQALLVSKGFVVKRVRPPFAEALDLDNVELFAVRP